MRCIIAVDAINEGDRESWTKALPALVEKLSPFQGIALAISCRTPFQHVLAPDSDKLGFQTTFHAGYPAEEQDTAVEKYFKAYGIPLPEVPLLEEEFSNPLFLKLFCEALEKVTVTQQHAQLTSIASGQRGMTHILEYFVRQKDQSISKRFGTPPGLSWRFVKNVLAPELATRHSDSLPLKDAEALANGSQPPGLPAGTLLHALIEEDVLAEDVVFDKEAPPTKWCVLHPKFSRPDRSASSVYQLYSADPTTIKASLADPKRLGFFFHDEDASRHGRWHPGVMRISYLTKYLISEAGRVSTNVRYKPHTFLLSLTIQWLHHPLRLGDSYFTELIADQRVGKQRKWGIPRTFLLRHNTTCVTRCVFGIVEGEQDNRFSTSFINFARAIFNSNVCCDCNARNDAYLGERLCAKDHSARTDRSTQFAGRRAAQTNHGPIQVWRNTRMEGGGGPVTRVSTATVMLHSERTSRITRLVGWFAIGAIMISKCRVTKRSRSKSFGVFTISGIHWKPFPD